MAFYDASGNEIEVFDASGTKIEPPKPKDPDVIVLKNKRKTFKVVIEEDGESDPALATGLPPGDYTLRELVGPARDDFVDMSLARAKRNPENGAYLGYTTKDLEAKLVHQCLFDSNGRQLPFQVVQGMAASALTELYQKCEELSSLNRMGEKRGN